MIRKKLKEILSPNIVKEKDRKLGTTLRSLSEKTAYLDNILRSSIDMGIVAMNLDFQIAYCNPAAEAILGLRADQVIGCDAREIHVWQNVDLVSFERACEGVRENRVHNFCFEKPTDNGNRFIHGRVTGIRDNECKLLGFVLMIKDITEKKRMEEELLRTQKLDSISVLAGGIAHDFNNLLTAVLGNISLAQIYAEHNTQLQQSLKQAEKACVRAKNLTRQLVTFAGSGEPHKSIQRIVELVVDTVNFGLSGSNVKSEIDVGEQIWAVDCDADLIRQMINNLTSNAREAMPGGGVLRIKLHNETLDEGQIPALAPGDYVRLTIEDQGKGIPSEHLSRIFDPYFSTKQRGDQKGMGMGLTIAYAVAKKHGGHIAVEPALKGGVAFNVFLPASLEEPAKLSEVVPLTSRIGGQILIMDDEELVREVAGRILQHLGYEVCFSTEGSQAIDMIEQAQAAGNPIDLVILDLTVPGGMGGEETIKHLRAKGLSVKTMVASGYSTDPVLANFEKYGFDGVVHKPFDIEQLGRKVREVLSQPGKGSGLHS